MENINNKPKHNYAMTKLINAKNYICYNESIAKIYNPITAIVFAELIDFAEAIDIACLPGQRAFSITEKKIADDTALSEHQVRAAIQKLAEGKLILVSKEGIPYRNFYTINIQKLTEITKKD